MASADVRRDSEPQLASVPAFVVTGASSGIGEACALRLAELGYRVFAGVRNDEAAGRLRSRAPDLLTPLHLDVSDAGSVRAAAARVATGTGGAGLDGLVNNAGIAVAAPLEFLPLDALREQLEINVVGQLAVTQALLPLLRTARGRIVNMGSISGRVALPFVGPYTASKFALEALTDSLRVELRPWGIHVAIVEPGVIATPIWKRSLAAFDTMLERMPPQVVELYGPAMRVVRSRVSRLPGASTEGVVQAVVHALTARRPRARYLVGVDARARLILNWMPWRLRDRAVARALR
ncbi:MAG TPA: SDR family oxidoreductase [Gemmatimonadaceae bacterium]|nr:SDR family oxidoreductase [Gemmatimonadaceae bacterium]